MKFMDTQIEKIIPLKIGILGIDKEDSAFWYDLIVSCNSQNFTRVSLNGAFLYNEDRVEIVPYQYRGKKYDQIFITPRAKEDVEFETIAQLLTHLSRIPEEFDYLKIQKLREEEENKCEN